MSNKIICSCCKEKVATWCYMPGYGNKTSPFDDYSCDDCVPRGCSCNDDNILYSESENDLEEFEYQANEFRKNYYKHSMKYVLKNYGQIVHHQGKHLEVITDQNMVKSIMNNVSNEQLKHYSFTPLDSKGREYPCCEYDYSEDGYDIEREK